MSKGIYALSVILGSIVAACSHDCPAPGCGDGGAGGGGASSTGAAPACDERHADCDGDTANGCEARLTDDAANCGACGVECYAPHASMGCDLSACFVDQCEPGYEDKDSAVLNGCESLVD